MTSTLYEIVIYYLLVINSRVWKIFYLDILIIIIIAAAADIIAAVTIIDSIIIRAFNYSVTIWFT
jgi:hypothetical protein